MRMNRPLVMPAIMAVANAPFAVDFADSRVVVSNRTKVPADSAERMAAAEAKRDRKAAKRLRQTR
jgi:hypothetical protein